MGWQIAWGRRRDEMANGLGDRRGGGGKRGWGKCIACALEGEPSNDTTL